MLCRVPFIPPRLLLFGQLWGPLSCLGSLVTIPPNSKPDVPGGCGVVYGLSPHTPVF